MGDGDWGGRILFYGGDGACGGGGWGGGVDVNSGLVGGGLFGLASALRDLGL